MLATSCHPQEQEYYYDSDISVLDIDETFPELAERVMQWQATQWTVTLVPPWWPSDFGRQEQVACNRPPDLREFLKQARGARAASQVPVQPVAPMQLPFESVRDLDCQCQLRHDQMLAKCQPSPLEAEQCKWARTPPQPDPHDALDSGHARTEEQGSRDRGHSRARGEDQQRGLDRAHSKSHACSKSRRHS